MHYLTEDPSYVLIALGLAVLGCLLALKVTQQGKFLIWAGGLAALAALVFGFERFYVTDAERIEQVVYDLANAVQTSNADQIKSHLDDKVYIGMKGVTMDGSTTLQLVLGLLQHTHFDLVRVGQLTTSAGSQTKRGSATFKVSATGRFEQGGTEFPLNVVGTEWSLSFQEKSPGVWKVTRITAITIPREVSRAIFGR